MIIKNYFSFKEILKAYFDCRKTKRNKDDALTYETNYIQNLIILLNKINSGEYKQGKSYVFAVLNPKPREIWASEFEDRIVQHLIYNSISEDITKTFIKDSYACIKERGVERAIEKAYKNLRKITNNFKENAYVLKMDISNYFMSIDKDILWNILKQKVDENCLLGKLIKDNVYYITLDDYYIKGSKNDLEKVPKKKSMWNADRKHGLPIGNLTSQFYSNLYLNLVDNFAKHILKCRYYVRYVDDIIILLNNKKQCNEIYKRYKDFLYENRKLLIVPDKVEIKNTKSGFLFLGVLIKPYRIYVKNYMLVKIKKFSYKLRKQPFVKDNFLTVQSYFGRIRHYQTFNFRKIIKKIIDISLIYKCDDNITKIIKYF